MFFQFEMKKHRLTHLQNHFPIRMYAMIWVDADECSKLMMVICSALVAGCNRSGLKHIENVRQDQGHSQELS